VRRFFVQIVMTILPTMLSTMLAIVFSSAPVRAQARAGMELLETKTSQTQTTIDIVGQVKNISPREVNGVTVVCDFQDAAGKLVKREQGHLDTDPLAPSKVSQFKISTPSNAAIKGFKVSFTQMFGGPLVTKDSRKP